MDKKSILQKILNKHKLSSEEIAYIGDDLGDLEVIKAVGLAGAVGDAHPLIKRISHFIAKRYGGRGAVREVIDFILDVQEKWPEIFSKLKSSDDQEMILKKINS